MKNTPSTPLLDHIANTRTTRWRSNARRTLWVAGLATALWACPKKGSTEPTEAPTLKETPTGEQEKPATPPPSTMPAPEDVAKPPADAKATPSGLKSRVITAGAGEDHPAANDTVEVHYTGWTTDGKMFDSSVTRGQPAKFPLNRVIKGWTEGVQLMVKGEKRRFWIPGKLAYGDKPQRPGAPAGTLVFDVELLSITPAPKPIAAPTDVAKPPQNSQKTSSGLSYRTLKKGTGAKKPASTDRVEVHYTGWTTDGKMFDSSVTRGEPAVFPLNAVIKGWTEGVQLMVEGETTRFWIPSKLAYGDRPGRPQGMLVFDVELRKIL